MAILELKEMIPVETPLGFGYAIFFESCEHDNFWTIGLSNGAIVTFTQSRIRLSRDYTRGRGIGDLEMAQIIRGKRKGKT